MSRNYNLAILPGDGTGPEVVKEGMRVISAAADKFGFKYDETPYDLRVYR